MRIALLFMVLTSVSCRSQSPATKTLQAWQYHTEESGGRALVTDSTDGFFNSVGLADVLIQMKKNRLESADLTAAKADYIAFLQGQAMAFSPEEMQKMDRVMTEAVERISALNARLIPRPIGLLKIRTDHYGQDVFYTRENNICIPENVLSEMSEDALVRVMLHEIWHILSRRHPALRSAAYRLIGFEAHGRAVVYPPQFDARRMTNPDGTDTDYAIDLGGGTLGLPLLYAAFAGYKEDLPHFTSYIRFDLFELAPTGEVVVTEAMTSTLTPAQQAVFFDKIEDNTQYIIHPDEITADNFVLAVNTAAGKEQPALSEEGTVLLNNFSDVCRQFQ